MGKPGAVSWIRRHKGCIWLGLAVISVLTFWGLQSCSEGKTKAYAGPALVIDVDDGDSFTVKINGHKDRVRILGMDAPELGQPYGKKAGLYLTSLLKKQTVSLSCVARDKYHRLLCHVRHHNYNIASIMVGAGLAWSYSKQLKSLENAARQNRLGLWRASNPIRPRKWRKVNP